MNFYLKDTDEHRSIEAKEWLGDGYGPDCFRDLETNFPADHDTEEGSNELICTSEEYGELLDWWREEARAMNDRGIGPNSDDYTENTRPELCIMES